MSQPIVLPQVVDGFSYNTQLQYHPLHFFPHALAQMDVLRRAANYRPRWWTVPDDAGEPAIAATPQTIAPYDTALLTISVPAGSYLWGYQFSVQSATDADGNPASV